MAVSESEIWKNIGDAVPGLGMYEVSNFGQIRNTKTGLVLKQRNNGGYRLISLSFGHGNMHSFSVHRIVLTVFEPGTFFEGAHVNHKNGVPHDNRLENLEFVSQADNNRRRKNPATVSAGNMVPVLQYDLNGNFIQRFDSVEIAARATGLYAASISGALNGNRNVKQTGGFVWKRVPAEEIEGEIWKNFPWNDDTVCISNFGRIRAKNGRIHTGHKNKQGYHQARIGNKTVHIHRLVALAFLAEPAVEQVCVDHINSNKSDNRVDNLRWATNQQNTLYANGREVVAVDVDTAKVRVFCSTVEAAQVLGVATATVHICAVHKTRAAAGHLIRYIDEYQEMSLKEIAEIRKQWSRSKKSIRVFSVNDGSERTFPSIRQAELFTGTKYQSILSAMRRGQPSRSGYRFEMVDE